MDEPLSALDLKLRQHMRTELRSIQQQVGITFIYITHDQGEALTMSDNVAVMREGIIEQVADSTSIYDHPDTAFVASFVGENNRFDGKIVSTDNHFAIVETPEGTIDARCNPKSSTPLKTGDDVYVFVRPESLQYVNGSSLDNVMKANVYHKEFEGQFWQIFLDVGPQKKRVKMSFVNDGSDRDHQENAKRTYWIFNQCCNCSTTRFVSRRVAIGELDPWSHTGKNLFARTG